MILAGSNFNRFDEAEKELRKAIRINPNYAEAHTNLGALSLNLNRYDESEREFREAIRINPNYAEAYYNLGSLLLTTGRKNEAKQSILKAKELFEKQGNAKGVKLCNDLLEELKS